MRSGLRLSKIIQDSRLTPEACGRDRSVRKIRSTEAGESPSPSSALSNLGRDSMECGGVEMVRVVIRQ